MNIQFLDNFEKEDQTNDYYSDFHYAFIIGVNADKDPLDTDRTIYADMSGYVNDSEADNFAVNVFNDDEHDDGRYRAYYLDEEDHQHFIDIPADIQSKLEKLTKVAVMATETEKIKECTEYYAEESYIIDNEENGLFCIEIGYFDGNPVYADYHAEIRTNETGKTYISPIYNMDNDKAYIIVPNEDFPDRKICFDVPREVLEKCEKKVKEVVSQASLTM